MPKFAIKIKVIATVEYTLEIEAHSEEAAINEACSRKALADNTPEDFAVDRGYCEFEEESEQLTAICPRCDVEHNVPTCDVVDSLIVDGKSVPNPDANWWHEDQDYCKACGVLEAAESCPGCGVPTENGKKCAGCLSSDRTRNA